MNLIDLHCDTIWQLVDGKEGQSLCANQCSVDLDGMKKAGTLAQFFACFVYMQEFQGENRYTEGYRHALKMIGRLKEELAREKDEIALAGSLGEILQNKEQGKISAILTIEEGGILDSNLGRLDLLYSEGVRLMTILWNDENCIGFPNSRDENVMQKGLKPFGFEVIERMNELGMIIDVSHLSDGGFWDVIQKSKVPVAASHSNARALCDHPRNLSDEMLKALSEKGGVAGLNFYPYFLNKSGKAGVGDLIRHLVHMVNVGGIELPAIGTDFDGFDEGETEITHVNQMEKLYEGLKKAGFTERQLDYIRFKNAFRIMREIAVSEK